MSPPAPTGFSHRPVLLAETLAALRPRPGGRFLDGTCGGGGHAAALLEAVSPGGYLIGLDRDAEALAAATVRLSEWKGCYELHQGNFADAGDWAPAGGLDGILCDLGVSSWQLDSPGRGFGFQHPEAPLDMRLDQRGGPTAADLVNELPAAELQRLFEENDEPSARRIARRIEQERTMRPIMTTGQLAGLVAQVAGRPGLRRHPGTLVFQALRIAVNDELGSLRRGLPALTALLKPGGRLAILTFHSGEDREVKNFMRAESRDFDAPPGEEDQPHLRRPRAPRAMLITRKPTEAGAAEVAANPRARSAKLRVLERL